MLRSLLCCLWPRSQEEGRSAKDIRNDLRCALAERRRVGETVAEAVQACADFTSTLRDLTEEFERRVRRVKLDPRLCRLTRKEMLRRWWTGELCEWSGPTPLYFTWALRDARHCLTIRREKLQEVNERIRSLQEELAEAAVKCKNVDLDFGLEQLDGEVFLPSEPLTTAPVSVQPNVDDWDARLAAASRKFLASSASVSQTLRHFDPDLTAPMREKDGRAETQHPLEHFACEKVASDVLFPGGSGGVLAAVQYASASVSVIAPVNYAIALVSSVATVECGTASVMEIVPESSSAGSKCSVTDLDARLDPALDAAHRRLQLSSAHVSLPAKQPDQVSMEPKQEEGWNSAAHKPPKSPCLLSERVKTWCQEPPELHVAGKLVTADVSLAGVSQDLIIPEESAMIVSEESAMIVPEESAMIVPEESAMIIPEESAMIVPGESAMIVPEESATTSMSDATPAESVPESDSVDHGNGSKRKAIDWDARLEEALIAARQRLLASSTRGCQAMTEPVQLSPCLHGDTDETQHQVPQELYVADELDVPGVPLLEGSRETIVPVQNATASTSVAAPAENATELVSVSAAGDHGSGLKQKPIDWHARLDAARQKARASRLRVRQSLERFDRELRV